MNLSKLYSDPKFPGSFGGLERFYREVKKKHPQVTRTQIGKFLKSQNAYTLHKQIRKPRRYRRTLVYGPRDLWQIDLLDFQKFSSENSGYRYLCVIINCFTKYVYVKPLKNKSGPSLVRALSLLLMTEGPKHVQADQGTEFFNRKVARMLEAFGPKLYHSYSEHKASIVERVQRTLRGRLGKLFTKRGNNVWIDEIDNIVESYNNSYHRSIKMKPADVTERHTAKIRRLLFPSENYIQHLILRLAIKLELQLNANNSKKNTKKGGLMKNFL